MNYEIGLDLNMWNTTLYHSNANLRPYVGPNIPLLKGRGVSWVTLRASAGTIVDWTFERSYKILTDAGIDVVMYHWFNPKIDWNPQVLTYLKAIGTRPNARMIDLEDTSNIKAYLGVFDRIKAFIDSVDIDYIYLNPAFMQYWRGETWLASYPLIIAHWDVVAPRVPKPWSPNMWYAWQYTAKENGTSFGLTTKEAAPYVRQI